MNRGLIEAESFSVVPDSLAGLPRFMNRGLIEAVSLLCLTCLIQPLPRFMNRGLIEAGGPAAGAAFRGDFPDS